MTQPYLHRFILLIPLLGLGGCMSLPFTEKSAETAELGPERQLAMIEPAQVVDPGFSPAPVIDSQAEAQPVLAPPKDLWERLRRNMSLEQVENERVETQLDWLRQHPKHMLWTSQRAVPYLYYIVEQTERRGMPAELALLPAIESGFRPRVHSRLKAAGLWQFIPSTGSAFGLKQDWWYDGRMDVVSSTPAAFDYLQHLADQFEGDWLLALAAYNAGPSLVRRSIERNRKEGLQTDYWSLDLPGETQRYVPRLLAVSRVVADPSAHGIALADIPNQPYLETVELPDQIDIKRAAQLAGLDSEELKRLNPGLKRWATAPDGPHHLTLPVGTADSFQAKLAALPKSQWVSLKRYKIRRGDTLGGIAQRHGTSVAAIKQANKLKSSRIRAGKLLAIPYPGEATDEILASLSDSNAAAATHIVQQGDSLWNIAREYELDHRQLARWNGMAVDDTLWPGQVLQLKLSKGKKSLSYKVRKGDSLYVIARRHGVSVAELRRWNGIDGNMLKPGQELTLYL